MFEQTEDTKKLHKIYLCIIFVLMIVLIFLLTMTFGSKAVETQTPVSRAAEPQKPLPPLEPLLNNVVQSIGINFESGQPIVIDSLTGKKIEPCRQADIKNTGENEQKSGTTCKTELKRISDGVYQLFDVETHKLIPSRIIKATFVLWEDSFHNTSFVEGGQYESGQTLEEKCKMLKQLGILDNPIYANNANYEADIKKCQQIR